MFGSRSGVKHSRLMPPAVNTSGTEWSSVQQHLPVHHYSHYTAQAPRNHHVLLSSTAILTPPPQISLLSPIMPYEDGSDFNYFMPQSHTPCSDNILEENSIDEYSYLTSSRSILDLEGDMASPLWSTATNKKVNLVVSDCWAAKSVRMWTENDVSDWLISLGANRERMAKSNFSLNGMDLAYHCSDRNFINSIEMELGIDIARPLQDYLEQETPTTEQSVPLPPFSAGIYEADVKQEDLSQPDYPHNWDQYQNRHESNFKHEDEYNSSDGESEADHRPAESTRGNRTGRRGRPPSITSKAAKRKLEKRHGRLWEFIRDLLKNPEYCPSLICWEDHDAGVFRFVSSEKVAQLWGSKRGNTKMTYEKLSRAMRYYYKSKILQPVTHRRLVYKFGPNATNWRHPNPNFRRPV